MIYPTKTPAPPHSRRGGAREPLDPNGDIAVRLRALYAEVEQEPIPADLIALLERLDEAEERRRS